VCDLSFATPSWLEEVKQSYDSAELAVVSKEDVSNNSVKALMECYEYGSDSLCTFFFFWSVCITVDALSCMTSLSVCCVCVCVCVSVFCAC